MKDIKSIIDVVQSVAPAAHTASSTGSSANLQGYQAAMAIVSFGTVTDGTHTPKLQESSDNSTFTDVAAGDLIGSFAAGASSTVQRVGYIGGLQYIRVVITVSGATTGALSGADIVRGFAEENALA